MSNKAENSKINRIELFNNVKRYVVCESQDLRTSTKGKYTRIKEPGATAEFGG